jgi:hypothetical protein
VSRRPRVRTLHILRCVSKGTNDGNLSTTVTVERQEALVIFEQSHTGDSSFIGQFVSLGRANIIPTDTFIFATIEEANRKQGAVQSSECLINSSNRRGILSKRIIQPHVSVATVQVGAGVKSHGCSIRIAFREVVEVEYIS